MATDREVVLQKWPDAFFKQGIANPGNSAIVSHAYSAQTQDSLTGWHFETEKEAWKRAAKRIKESE